MSNKPETTAALCLLFLLSACVPPDDNWQALHVCDIQKKKTAILTWEITEAFKLVKVECQ